MTRNILIVDDEPVQAKMLGKLIKDMNHEIMIMSNGQEVVDFFLDKKNNINHLMPYDIDVMLLDLSMPKISGLDVLKQISSVKGDLQVIVLTASNDVSLAVNAINLGAVDYIIKGEKDVFARVVASINNAVEKRNLKYQVYNLERRNRDQVIFSDIIGNDHALNEAISLAKKAANSIVPVLIEGARGTGKELFARAIHGSGARSGKPFVMVDCASLKPNNFDEVLFGYEKKAENGNVERSPGKIREAIDGTLFFDNVGELKMEVQIKLLRFLQDNQFQPVGSKAIYKNTSRIICSCDEDLLGLVRKRKFREDLCYRLNIFPIRIPSLIERGPEDMHLLSEHFCYNASVNENKKIKGLSDNALKLLLAYEWEDNVRQLRNYIFRAVVLCDEEYLEPRHFPQIMMLEDRAISISRLSSMIKKPRTKNSEMIDIFDEDGDCKSLDEIEYEIVQRLYQVYDGNLSEISKQLKVSRSTIYRKLDMMNSKDEMQMENVEESED